nr:hypothetical protein Q903MT_gene2097 [Picea sitchensis]
MLFIAQFLLYPESDPVHFPFFLPRIEFILTTEISHSQVIEGQEREERLGLGSLDP